MASEHYHRLDKYQTHNMQSFAKGKVPLSPNYARQIKVDTFTMAGKTPVSDEPIYDKLSGKAGMSLPMKKTQNHEDTSTGGRKEQSAGCEKLIKNSNHVVEKPPAVAKQQRDSSFNEDSSSSQGISVNKCLASEHSKTETSRFGHVLAGEMSKVEDLYAKPLKQKQKEESIVKDSRREKSKSLFFKIARGSLKNEGKENLGVAVNSEPPPKVDAHDKKIRTEKKGSHGQQILGTKDNMKLVECMRQYGLHKEASLFVEALRKRFELEEEYIKACAQDGARVVEGDYDDDVSAHKSIGGLKMYGVKKRCILYDEYDPEILAKFSDIEKDAERVEIALTAANLRREAAELMWDVGNLERFIDKNSRVQYVRHARKGTK